MVDTTGTTNYTGYDALNRLTSVTFPGSRTVGYSYDNSGRRATITYAGGTNQATYGYDVANNLTSVTDWNSKQTAYGYDNAGNLASVTLPSGTGVVGTYSYDTADRLTGISWAKGASTLASASYTLDSVGNRSQRVDQAGTQTYGYDNDYRLNAATYPGPVSDSYTYDAFGNRLTQELDELQLRCRRPHHRHRRRELRLRPFGPAQGRLHGNQTARGTDSFAWDVENRMTSATINSATMTAGYNGDGLRNSRTAGGTTTTFTWDVAQPVPQILDDGTLKYVYGLGRVSQVGSTGTTYYYLADALGSTMALVDATGAVANTYNYDAFGTVTSQTGTVANEFKFAGEQLDAWSEPTTQREALDTVVSSTNLTGATVTNLQDDPDSPDANWATATSVADTNVRAGFANPSAALRTGAGLQEFRVLLRKNAANGNNPTYDLELWETGGASRLALLASGVSLSSSTGTVVSATWDASLLTTADGSKVELKIVGHAAGNGGTKRTVEIGAAEWNAATSTPVSAFYYLRARYYDPATGRFLSRDPLDLGNRFSYVSGNPASDVDPLGLCAMGLIHGSCGAAAKAVAKAVAPAVGQCATWGVAGAVLGGGVQGFLAGCAAGTASYFINKYVPPGPGRSLAQCGIWAAGAVLATPRTLGLIVMGGLAAAACGAGAASDRDSSHSDANECGIWGLAGAVAGLITRSTLATFQEKALVGCAAGLLSNEISGAHDDGPSSTGLLPQGKE